MLPAATTTMMPARDAGVNGLHQRIGRRGREGRMAERQVDDVNAERLAVHDRELRSRR